MNGVNKSNIFIDLTSDNSTGDEKVINLVSEKQTSYVNSQAHCVKPSSRKYSEHHKFLPESQEVCPVCLLSLKERKVVHTPCKHSFCAPCLLDCIIHKEQKQQQQYFSCPLCRYSPTFEQLLQIKELLGKYVVDLTEGPADHETEFRQAFNSVRYRIAGQLLTRKPLSSLF